MRKLKRGLGIHHSQLQLLPVIKYKYKYKYKDKDRDDEEIKKRDLGYPSLSGAAPTCNHQGTGPPLLCSLCTPAGSLCSCFS